MVHPIQSTLPLQPAPVLLPFLSAGHEVPRVIHQTYPTHALPAVLAANRQHMAALNPGWELHLHDDDDIEAFIRQAYGAQMLEIYRRIHPHYGAARADLFRYLLIYSRGGVYLDIKATTLKPLDSVLEANDRYLLCHWPNRPGEAFAGWGQHAVSGHLPRGEFQQWHVIAAPGHPFLAAVIECVMRNLHAYRVDVHGVGKAAVLLTTGPIAYTRALLPLLNLHPHRRAEVELDLGLRYSILAHGANLLHAQHLFAQHYSRATVPLVVRG